MLTSSTTKNLLKKQTHSQRFAPQEKYNQDDMNLLFTRKNCDLDVEDDEDDEEDMERVKENKRSVVNQYESDEEEEDDVDQEAQVVDDNEWIVFDHF